MADRFDDWVIRHEVEPLGPRPDAYQHIARSARRRRTGRAAATATAVSVVLIATAGVALRLADRPGPPPDPGTSTSPTATAAPVTPPTSESVPTSPSSPAAGTSQSMTGRCRTNELRVTVEPSPGGGSAGSMWHWFVFTNRSTRTCTLYGYPGVSFVTGASGTQVNEPARRDGSQSVLVTLAPGQAGHATMRTGHNEAFPDTCQPVPIAGYRVYVPDETASVFVSQAGEACSTKGVNSMSISPVYPGNTE
jgi:hypothetical protein